MQARAAGPSRGPPPPGGHEPRGRLLTVPPPRHQRPQRSARSSRRPRAPAARSGLAVAIDYGLLIVSRYREELEAGYTGETAIGRTIAPAGRTVVISGITVAAALAGLASGVSVTTGTPPGTHSAGRSCGWPLAPPPAWPACNWRLSSGVAAPLSLRRGSGCCGLGMRWTSSCGGACSGRPGSRGDPGGARRPRMHHLAGLHGISVGV
ncbi:MMPL family transporter [Streptomyces sp. NPDC088760]|uniref:MMPL family transporter n=1 Tax=Streptomyces sp. NPDC088760 TaxID=3365890 RepID=UPI0038230B60